MQELLQLHLYALIRYTGISRLIVNPAELEMQPTIHFQSLRGYFKYRIVLK
jgi:hypothetical protein